MSVSGSALQRPATSSTSPSFQRSTPSAITNRRPIANVIAVSAPTMSSGVQVVLVDLDARRARGGLGHRAQARAPLGDAAVVVAVDQVGGAEGGHGDDVSGRSSGTGVRLGGLGREDAIEKPAAVARGAAGARGAPQRSTGGWCSA